MLGLPERAMAYNHLEVYGAKNNSLFSRLNFVIKNNNY